MSTAETTKFGKYELLERIATGGMAEIFRARYEPAPGITKQVVIKRILPTLAENTAFIGMFTNEAKIVMGLSHGNIAQVFDFGSIDGAYFLAMELVDGYPLSTVVKRAKALGFPVIPPEFAAFICAEVLKGLQYAHTRLDEEGRPLRIVHRDVSPQNVLISFEGQVKLVDFGIAKARSEATRVITAANSVKGKYAYFSPEQAQGRTIDSRIDVFAAGIVLYELLTGELPYQGNIKEVLSCIATGKFRPPRALNGGIPVELERIVLKAMALSRDVRYQTAEAFQQDLNRFLANNFPEFTSSMVMLLLQFLFEEELVKNGRPVQLPRDFVERSHRWKAPISPAEVDDLHEEPEDPTEVLVLEPGRRSNRAWRWLALLVTLGAAGFGTFPLMEWLNEATLDITSNPPGASVILDGTEQPSKTPLQIEHLPGDRTVKLAISSPGYQSWENEVPLKAGQNLVVQADLQPVPVEPPPVEIVDVLVEPPAPPPPPPLPPDEVTWPVATFEIDASRHRLDLSSAEATVVALQPANTYRVSLLGKNRQPSWGFYVVSAGGSHSGAFGDDPLLINGASRLYAFNVPASVLGAKLKDEVKPRQLSVQREGQKKATIKSVGTSLSFPSSQRVTVSGLSASAVYELTPHQGIPPAVVRERGEVISRVMLGSPAGLAVAPLDTAYRIEGTSSFWVTLLDDKVDGEAGRLTFELKELKKRGAEKTKTRGK